MTDSRTDVIVNFTPTGMLPTRDMTPHVPLTPAEIIRDVRDAWALGITSVHLHVRDVEGRPSLSPDLYAEVISGIRAFAPDLVICVSLSGRLVADPELRAAPLNLDGALKPDMGSLTLSSLNFNKTASINAPDTVAFLARRMQEHAILPELEAFDSGMLNYARYLRHKGLLGARCFVNLIVGNIASAQPNLLHLGMMVNDLPPGALWAMGGIGNCQAQVHGVAIAMGGGVRVGLEDNIWFDPDRTRLAYNLDLLRRVHQFADMFGRRVMPPAVFRRELGLAPGRGVYGLASGTPTEDEPCCG